MSVLLTSPIYIDSVLTPAGTTVSLGYQREQQIVAAGEGTWVVIPTTPIPPAVRPGFVSYVTGPNGEVSLQEGGSSFPIVEITGIDPSNTSNQNRTALVTQLARGGVFKVSKPGKYLIDDVLRLKSNTTIIMCDGAWFEYDAFQNQGALCTSTITGGVLTGITIGTQAAAGTYDPAYPPRVLLSGGEIFPAVVEAVADFATGAITGFNIINPGNGYDVAPIIELERSPLSHGVQATATATISGGKVTAINIVNAGTGYDRHPKVFVKGPVGAQVTVAVNANGTLGAFTIAHGGANYQRAPVVSIIGGKAGNPVFTNDDWDNGNENITLIDCGWSQNTEGSFFADRMNQHATYFQQVKNLNIVRPRPFNCTKYCVFGSWIWGGRVTDCNIPYSFSDGIHFNGPCWDVVVEGTTGTTADDLVAFTGQDVDKYAPVMGGFSHCHVKNTYCVNAQTGVSTYPAYDRTNALSFPFSMTVDGVYGTVQDVIVKLNTFTNGTLLANCDVDTYTVDNVIARKVGLTNPYPGIYIYAVNVKNLHLGKYDFNCKLPTVVAGINAFAVDALSTIENLFVDHYSSQSMFGGTHFVFFGKVKRLFVNSYNIKATKAGSDSMAFYWHSTSVFPEKAVVGPGYAENLSSFIKPEFAAATSMVTVKDPKWVTVDNGIVGRGPMRVHLEGADHNGAAGGGSIFSTNADGAFIVTGGNNKQSGGVALVRTVAGAPAIKPMSFNWEMDVSLTNFPKTANSFCYNTNAALACGAGPVVCDGTNWKHLFTGALY